MQPGSSSDVHDVEPFALVVAVVAAALLLAVASNRLTSPLGVPPPAIFLVVAAAVSAWFGSLPHLSVVADQRIVTVALAVILFDGGMHIGLARLRPNLGGVVWLGTAGTVVTAAALMLLAHGCSTSAGGRAADGRRNRAHRSGGRVLGVGQPRDRGPGRHAAGGRVRRERSGRHRADGQPDSAASCPAARRSPRGGQFCCRWWSALPSASSAAGAAGLMRRVAARAGVVSVATIAFALLVFGVAGCCTAPDSWPCSSPASWSATPGCPYQPRSGHFTRPIGTLGEIVAFVVLGLSVSSCTQSPGPDGWWPGWRWRRC